MALYNTLEMSDFRTHKFRRNIGNVPGVLGLQDVGNVSSICYNSGNQMDEKQSFRLIRNNKFK